MRRRLAALRQPPAASRIARVLLVTCAFLVWNVVFDRVIVVAGRAYIHAAGLAAGGSGPWVRAGDWMRPAAPRAFWTATAAAAAILVPGFLALRARGARPKGV